MVGKVQKKSLSVSYIPTIEPCRIELQLTVLYQDFNKDLSTVDVFSSPSYIFEASDSYPQVYQINVWFPYCLGFPHW
jgi:hypothetical protein